MPADNTTGNPEDIIAVPLSDIPMGKPCVRQSDSRNLYRVSASSTYACLDITTEELVQGLNNELFYHAEVTTSGGDNVFTRVNPPAPTP